MNIEISQEADMDLEDIFDHTLEKHGASQALKYVSSFDKLFSIVCSNPEIGRDRSEIRKNLKSIVKEQHIVFYRILVDRIRIVRILHGSRDLPKSF